MATDSANVNANDNDVKLLEANIETLRLAMVDANGLVLGNLACEELTYGHSNGNLQTKAEFVETIVSGKSDFLSIRLTNPFIKIYGDTAIARHEFNAETNDGGKPGSVRLHILWVWRKESGGWKMLARQAVRM